MSTGMNLGVSIGPWGVKRPARALVWLQQAETRKKIFNRGLPGPLCSSAFLFGQSYLKIFRLILYKHAEVA